MGHWGNTQDASVHYSLNTDRQDLRLVFTLMWNRASPLTCMCVRAAVVNPLKSLLLPQSDSANPIYAGDTFKAMLINMLMHKKAQMSAVM